MILSQVLKFGIVIIKIESVRTFILYLKSLSILVFSLKF